MKGLRISLVVVMVAVLAGSVFLPDANAAIRFGIGRGNRTVIVNNGVPTGTTFVGGNGFVGGGFRQRTFVPSTVVFVNPGFSTGVFVGNGFVPGVGFVGNGFVGGGFNTGFVGGGFGCAGS